MLCGRLRQKLHKMTWHQLLRWCLFRLRRPTRASRHPPARLHAAAARAKSCSGAGSSPSRSAPSPAACCGRAGACASRWWAPPASREPPRQPIAREPQRFARPAASFSAPIFKSSETYFSRAIAIGRGSLRRQREAAADRIDGAECRNRTISQCAKCGIRAVRIA